MQYLQLKPESTLPDISSLKPFRCVVIIEETVTPQWQEQVSHWLVKAGCLYMMAWGKKCISWDDSVMNANIKEFEGEEIPEEDFVMTTWHEGESLLEVFWFAKHSAFHPEVEIRNTLLLHISNISKMQKFLQEYAAV
jgi:hypothetical protein